jgi:microcystin-dependent protein
VADPLTGEIRLFGGGFTPPGWLPCDGSRLAISQHQALFAVIGTAYGSDGVTYFQVPDLRDRVPIGAESHQVGQVTGALHLNEGAIDKTGKAPYVVSATLCVTYIIYSGS